MAGKLDPKMHQGPSYNEMIEMIGIAIRLLRACQRIQRLKDTRTKDKETD